MADKAVRAGLVRTMRERCSTNNFLDPKTILPCLKRWMDSAEAVKED